MQALDPLSELTLPRALFSASGRPPADSLEIYLPAPASLSLLGEEVATDPAALRAVRGIYGDSVRRATAVLAGTALAGPVAHHPRAAMYLQITAQTHVDRPTESGAGWHAHLYVGRQGKGVDDGLPRSARHLLDLGLAAHETFLDNRAWLQVATEHYLGVRWSVPPGLEYPEIARTGAGQELVQLQRLTVCRGEFGPLTRIRADDPYLTESPLVDLLTPPASAQAA